jgi:effector-binding domain-containing protein
VADESPDPVKRRLWITLVVLLLLLAAVGVFIAILEGGDVAYESPRYRVSERLGEVEIRDYEPYLVAEAEVDGPLEDAGNRGFRILAKYIFGDNRADTKVAMTAPVSQTKVESTKIAMTTPVTQERTGDRYTIQFMMPSKYTHDTLPVPNDERIRIRKVEGRRVAAIQYSGRWTKKNYAAHLDALVRTLKQNGLEPIGEPVWARYDPPFKPWFMRRNEILTAFRSAGSSD